MDPDNIAELENRVRTLEYEVNRIDQLVVRQTHAIVGLTEQMQRWETLVNQMKGLLIQLNVWDPEADRAWDPLAGRDDPLAAQWSFGIVNQMRDLLIELHVWGPELQMPVLIQ